MGVMCQIMNGNGLQELFNIINSRVPTNSMMTRHSYVRAIKYHVMANLILAQITLSKMNLMEESALLSNS